MHLYRMQRLDLKNRIHAFVHKLFSVTKTYKFDDFDKHLLL